MHQIRAFHFLYREVRDGPLVRDAGQVGPRCGACEARLMRTILFNVLRYFATKNNRSRLHGATHPNNLKQHVAL